MAYGVLQRRAVKRPLPAQRHYAAWTSHVQRATNKKKGVSLGCRGKKKDNKEKEKKGKEKKRKKEEEKNRKNELSIF
jgi:hypothetical protein